MKIALWAQNAGYPVTTLENWLDVVEEQIVKAKGDGAEIFVMPEYSSSQWMHFFPKDIDPSKELYKMAKECSPVAIEGISALSKKHDILIISGSFPVDRPELDPPLSNRAHIHFPDGKLHYQDKMCLTPFEKNPDDWNLSPDNKFRPFEYKGYKFAVIICLDIELPSLSAKIADMGIDMVLVPSMTSKLAGYHRVFDCAKARAVELFAAIGVVGIISGAEWCEQDISGASFFVPCEEEFGHTGVLASVPPSYKAEGAGPLLVADVPLDEIRKMRKGKAAEVWPGSWKADNIVIENC